MLDTYRLATLHECTSRTVSAVSFPGMTWNEEELGLSETPHYEDTERLESTMEEATSVG